MSDPSSQLPKPCLRGHVSERAKNRTCKQCNLERQRAERATHPERQRLRRSAWRGADAPTRPRPVVCELCGGPPNGHGVMHLDHQHDTGAFRGWLCSRCNRGLGMLGDTREGIERALAYLQRTSPSSSNT